MTDGQDMNAAAKSERISLSPSGWNDFRPFHRGNMARWGLAACLPAPLLVLGVILDSQWLLLTAGLLSGVAALLAVRGERDAFFTPARVHFRLGLLGLVVEDVPIHQVDQVLVDPIPRFPEMGNITVQCGAKHLWFECVPNADAKAGQILELAKAARERHQSA